MDSLSHSAMKVVGTQGYSPALCFVAPEVAAKQASALSTGFLFPLVAREAPMPLNLMFNVKKEREGCSEKETLQDQVKRLCNKIPSVAYGLSSKDTKRVHRYLLE